MQNITTSISVTTLSGTTPVMQVNNWIIFQQRVNDGLNWYLPWINYTNGFGALGGSYWMGNEKVHLLTTSCQYMLRMEMMSITIGWVSAEYSFFYLDDESQFYKIHLGGYSGDCEGDPMLDTCDNGIFYHNGMNFSTSDSDNDKFAEGNCASCAGGWWFNNCANVNLNGKWSNGFNLYTLASYNKNLMASRMMIKLH